MLFSGIQPPAFHIGNYLGAIRNWVTQQARYDNIFCIVDLHALSVPRPRRLRANNRDLANVLLACRASTRSVDHLRAVGRPRARRAGWLLNSVTPLGELRRMTQFKDKSGGNDEQISTALFAYPVLQAADILLYDADLVPVGDDQKQHVELTRDIAARFNGRYGEPSSCRWRTSNRPAPASWPSTTRPRK